MLKPHLESRARNIADTIDSHLRDEKLRFVHRFVGVIGSANALSPILVQLMERKITLTLVPRSPNATEEERELLSSTLFASLIVSRAQEILSQRLVK